jgi:hypothetical protein
VDAAINSEKDDALGMNGNVDGVYWNAEVPHIRMAASLSCGPLWVDGNIINTFYQAHPLESINAKGDPVEKPRKRTPENFPSAARVTHSLFHRCG